MARVHGMGDPLLDAIFFGFAQPAGGGWTGDLLVVDLFELEAAGNFNDPLCVNVKRFKADEVHPDEDQFFRSNIAIFHSPFPAIATRLCTENEADPQILKSKMTKILWEPDPSTKTRKLAL